VRRLIYLPAARGDLNAILRHIAVESGSLRVANDFATKLECRCERIASLPGTLGTGRPELRADIRSVSEQGYIIFFRYTDEQVEIVNVIPGHRDVAAQFDPPQSH